MARLYHVYPAISTHLAVAVVRLQLFQRGLVDLNHVTSDVALLVRHFLAQHAEKPGQVENVSFY